jgi:deoxyribonuclease-2
MDSYCIPSYKYDNINIRAIALQGGQSWTSTADHSKWVISSDSSQAYACIGDINRQLGQWKRGGGTYCIQDIGLWQAFKQIISDKDTCSKSVVMEI